MRTLRPTELSPPAVYDEPITLLEVEKYLELPTLDPVDEGRNYLLQTLIEGAREQAEILQNRDLVVKQWTLTLDNFPTEEIALRGELISVQSVKYTDATGSTTELTETTDYVVDTVKQPGIICSPFGKTWPSFTPWPTSAVSIRFTAGPSSVPALILIGMKRLISEWFNNRLPFELGASAVQEYPYGVTQCLRYKRVPYA